MARNSEFHFKKFSIKQDQCAMKVTSDACLFGGWVDVSQASRILDIGTGTGLLALMAAQRTSGVIDAIEMDKDAAEQAQENTRVSCWTERINVFNTSLQTFVLKARSGNYDSIICNPPFYNDSPKSHSHQKRIAWHDDTLPLNCLVQYGKKMLSSNGRIQLMLPAVSKERLESACEENNLFIEEVVGVIPLEGKDISRLFIKIGRRQTAVRRRCLVVYDKHQVLSETSREILRPYYLNL